MKSGFRLWQRLLSLVPFFKHGIGRAEASLLSCFRLVNYLISNQTSGFFLVELPMANSFVDGSASGQKASKAGLLGNADQADRELFSFGSRRLTSKPGFGSIFKWTLAHCLAVSLGSQVARQKGGPTSLRCHHSELQTAKSSWT